MKVMIMMMMMMYETVRLVFVVDLDSYQRRHRIVCTARYC